MDRAERIRTVLDARRVDLFATDGDWAQFEVMLEAFAVYLERNERYTDLWHEYGACDTVHHCRSKVLRLERDIDNTATTDSFNLDDGYDLVNYAVFTIRNIEEGNLRPSV